MSDDDYRPLHTIAPDLFVKNGKYQAYYCYNLRDWTGTAGMPTSFDRCMFRTAEFLREHQYPRKLYASHQPQVIDKRIFLQKRDARDFVFRYIIRKKRRFDWNITTQSPMATG